MNTARVLRGADSGEITGGAGGPEGARKSPGGVGIEGFASGPYQTNCYVVWPINIGTNDPKACWIVDAGFEPGLLIGAVRSRGLTPEAVVLTHAHVDHIAGIGEVRQAFPGVPVWIHSAEQRWLNDPVLNLSAYSGESVTAPGPDRLLEGGETLSLGPTTWHVLHTPGHSPGSIALWNEGAGVVLSGDALFAGSVGRTDFPGSDHATLMKSIREKLYTLPNATRVLSGHGSETTIGRERVSNPYVRG